MVINIVILLLLFILFIIYLKLENNAKFIADKFRAGNVIVFGAKGKGKDLLFQKMIRKRKAKYFSNVSYGYKFNYIKLSQLELGNNTYENFIADNIELVDKNNELERADVYISDAGVYLPAQYHYLLDKRYKSLPIFYALSRHLYLNNVHVNTQALNRVWDKLREQADSYFKCLKTVKFFGLLFTKVRYYETYQTASENRAPMRRRILNKFSKGLTDEYQAYNGIVCDMWICQRASKIKYDTRYFSKIVFKKQT